MISDERDELQQARGSDVQSGDESSADRERTESVRVKRKRGRPPKVLSEEKVSTRKWRKANPSKKAVVMAPKGSAWDALENPEKYALPPQMRGHAAIKADVLRGDAPREQLNVRVRSELKRAAQIMAAAENLTLGDIVEEALINHIKKNGKKLLE